MKPDKYFNLPQENLAAKYKELQEEFKKYATHTKQCRVHSSVDGYEECNCGFSKYSHTALREHMEECSKEVKTWPEWKQNILGGSRGIS